MFFQFSKVYILVYFLFLNFSSLSGIHIDHSVESNESHVCVGLCEPVDTCNDKTSSGPHEEESLLEHILDQSGLCTRSFLLKLALARSLNFENLQAKIQVFLSSGIFIPYISTTIHDIFITSFSQTRAPPIFL